MCTTTLSRLVALAGLQSPPPRATTRSLEPTGNYSPPVPSAQPAQPAQRELQELRELQEQQAPYQDQRGQLDQPAPLGQLEPV